MIELDLTSMMALSFWLLASGYGVLGTNSVLRMK